MGALPSINGGINRRGLNTVKEMLQASCSRPFIAKPSYIRVQNMRLNSLIRSPRRRFRLGVSLEGDRARVSGDIRGEKFNLCSKN